MWIFGWNGASGFSACSTAEQATQGIDGTALAAIVTGVVNWVGKYVLKNVPQGAATQCYVALDPQVKGVSGEYL